MQGFFVIIFQVEYTNNLIKSWRDKIGTEQLAVQIDIAMAAWDRDPRSKAESGPGNVNNTMSFLILRLANNANAPLGLLSGQNCVIQAQSALVHHESVHSAILQFYNVLLTMER